MRIASLEPCTVANLTVWGDRAKHKVAVKLDSMGEETLASMRQLHHENLHLGLAVRSLTPDERQQAHTHGGLLVHGVGVGRKRRVFSPETTCSRLMVTGRPPSAYSAPSSSTPRDTSRCSSSAAGNGSSWWRSCRRSRPGVMIRAARQQ